MTTLGDAAIGNAMGFMRDETRRKLNDRAAYERWIYVTLLTLGVLVFGAFALPWGKSTRTVLGVVRYAVVKVNPETGQRYPELQVALEDGQVVNSGAKTIELPKVHDTVRLTETKSITGFRSYMWQGPSPD